MTFQNTPISRRQAIATAAALAAPTLLQGAHAQSVWPNRPLKIVVGFPGGSSPDLTARLLAEPLQQALGQPVVVENKVGAGGNIAAALVARATDDHTIGLMINGNLTIAKILNPAINYDPLKDLAPVTLIATSPLVLTVPAGTTATGAAYFEAARQSGDRWNYGTPGLGTVAHLGMELLKAKAGIAPVHVPYPGNPQVITALLGAQIQMSLLPPGLAMAQVRAGKLKAIGVTSSGRSSARCWDTADCDRPVRATSSVTDASPSSRRHSMISRSGWLMILSRPDMAVALAFSSATTAMVALMTLPTRTQ